MISVTSLMESLVAVRTKRCQSLLQLSQKQWSACLLQFEQLQQQLCWSETTHRADVHPVMREFGIFSGYRHTGRGWGYYLRSAFRLHNETLNWLSHALGSLLIIGLGAVLTLRLPATADPVDVRLAWLFCLTSALMHTVSALAHLMHNHSELSHCLVFFADNAAVGLASYVINLLGVAFFSSHSYYSFIGPATMPTLVFGTICMSSGFSLALAAYRRRYNPATSLLMFGPSSCFLFFGLAPVIERRLLSPDEPEMLGMTHYYLFFLAILCYATCFPECLWPGRFDLLLHSHQLFHCLATASHCMLLSSVFSLISDDSPHLFSKRSSEWVSMETACRGLGVAFVFSVCIVALLAKAFRYDTSFSSRASTCCKAN
ncbi:hypothetical protein BOX15_Mlig025014g1 [Macrostomum lignano]|uniref:Uncharacterized protein n=1 Tax=Macrostomum lignano TaxID=282301 RepID=A0A267F7Q8_9PLAT|nr:hypothetical protein BOX15_Mlig025014g2 [Macrostomum lignano]PAA69811.1 hypothetical protein BOX15_Mlig025014g1 [Macrostomum lignano]